MVVAVAPAAALVMAEAEFLLEIQTVALDPPAQLGDLHRNTVNSRLERFNTLLRRRRGVATKYLGSWLASYHLAILPKLPTPHSVLAWVAGPTPVGHPMRTICTTPAKKQA